MCFRRERIYVKIVLAYGHVFNDKVLMKDGKVCWKQEKHILKDNIYCQAIEKLKTQLSFAACSKL